MRKQEQQGIAKAAQLRTQAQGPFGAPGQAWALGGAQEEMFEAMRAALPILDAAVGKLVRLVGDEPRGRLGIPGDPGCTVVEISEPYRIDPGTFASKGKSTPFAGMEVYGRCMLTVYDGNVVYAE